MNLTGWITKKVKAHGKKNVHNCLIVSNLNVERGMQRQSLHIGSPLYILLAALKALTWKLFLVRIVCWHTLLHSQHLRDCCSVLMLSFRKWLPKSLGRVLSLQKECSTLHSQKAVMIWITEYTCLIQAEDVLRISNLLILFPHLRRYASAI